MKSKALLAILLVGAESASEAYPARAVDDFENYDDYCNRIYFSWMDGWGFAGSPNCGVVPCPGNSTGSTVGYLEAPFAEKIVVHTGSQSMPYFYENGMKPFYSEATRTFHEPQDWTTGGYDTLELWFYGSPDNDAEPMYLALQDADKHSAVARLNLPDLLNIRVPQWHRWSIRFAAFTNDNGNLNLTGIKSISIGFGYKDALEPGGSGLVFFDDISLVPEPATMSLFVLGAPALRYCRLRYSGLNPSR